MKGQLSILGLLALIIAVQAQIPQGFSIFFDGTECPSGWSELTVAKGRLIVSVTDSTDVGVTVNAPLANREDRTHAHFYEVKVNMVVKQISADGCCNGQGACANDYLITGDAVNSTSGLPYVQLILCTINEPDETSPIAYGTVGYFDPTGTSGASCPAGWTELAESTGRVIIPSYPNGGVMPSTSPPLSSGQDLKHSHSFTSFINTIDCSYAGITGCCNDELAENNNYTISSETSPNSAGIPYIQLLTCVSTNQTFDMELPVGALVFNEIACPNGWNASLDISGRFPVALPENGEAGATFGGDSLPSEYQGSVNHTHSVSGSFSTSSCEVGLASGCCGSGYAENNQYSFSTVSAGASFDLPYLSMPLCFQYDKTSKKHFSSALHLKHNNE